MAKPVMARVQLLLPPDLKAEIEAYGEQRGISMNEAMRVLCRLALSQSQTPGSVTDLAELLLGRVRDLEFQARRKA